MVDYKDALNVPYNAILPFNPMRYQLAVGSAEYVAIEVLISKIIRMVLDYDTKKWGELVAVHAVSLSYMGGAAGFLEPPGPLESTFTAQLQDGAKGIPAVFLAQYTVDTLNRGFHTPFTKWKLEDVLISAASKAISRPLFGLIYPFIKGTVGPTLSKTNELVQRQTVGSILSATMISKKRHIRGM